jgi:hypothetical protein
MPVERLTLRGCVTEKQKNKQKKKKTSRDLEFLRHPWGDQAEIFRVDRGHAGLQKTPKLFLGDPI